MTLPVTEPNYLGPWTSAPVAFQTSCWRYVKRGIGTVYIRPSPGPQWVQSRPPCWERRHRLLAAAGKRRSFHDHLENDD